MIKILLFAALFFVSGCLVVYKSSVDGLEADTFSAEDDSVKGLIGRYYARINYHDELTIDVMCFGLQERFVSQGGGWLTLVFRKSNKTKPLWNNYFFDISKLKTDIGTLKPRSGTLLNLQGELLNITELLNSSPDGVFFATYDFAANEYYKPFGELYFDGLIFNKNSVPTLELAIKNQELVAKVTSKTEMDPGRLLYILLSLRR